MKNCFFILAMVILPLPVLAFAKPMTVSYLERPPYYYTTATGQAAGLLVERTRAILSSAGIEADFLSLSPNQIIYVIQYLKVPHCSIGWFKKPERELYAKFTRAIYRNRPLVLLTKQGQKKLFSQNTSLKQIFSRKQLVMARMSSFSYGSYVDQLLEKYNPSSYFGTSTQTDLLAALFSGQANYMLVAPEEVAEMAKTAGLTVNDFELIELNEIPAGNLRYLMCDQAVSDETIERINKAIEKLYPGLK